MWVEGLLSLGEAEEFALQLLGPIKILLPRCFSVISALASAFSFLLPPSAPEILPAIRAELSSPRGPAFNPEASDQFS